MCISHPPRPLLGGWRRRWKKRRDDSSFGRRKTKKESRRENQKKTNLKTNPKNRDELNAPGLIVAEMIFNKATAISLFDSQLVSLLYFPLSFSTDSSRKSHILSVDFHFKSLSSVIQEIDRNDQIGMTKKSYSSA